MSTRVITLAAAFCLCTSAFAAQPNLTPGQWQYETTTVFEGDTPIPEQTDTRTDCLTQEKLDEEDLLQDFGEACDVIEQDIRSDGMDFAVRCDVEGNQTNMNGNMSFMGDSTEGTIDVQAESPMGLMTMHVKMSGSRIGDCE